MIYYEISFPLTLILKYNFVRILLLMTFISISISLATSNIYENIIIYECVWKKWFHNYCT